MSCLNESNTLASIVRDILRKTLVLNHALSFTSPDVKSSAYAGKFQHVKLPILSNLTFRALFQLLIKIDQVICYWLPQFSIFYCLECLYSVFYYWGGANKIPSGSRDVRWNVKYMHANNVDNTKSYIQIWKIQSIQERQILKLNIPEEDVCPSLWWQFQLVEGSAHKRS